MALGISAVTTAMPVVCRTAVLAASLFLACAGDFEAGPSSVPQQGQGKKLVVTASSRHLEAPSGHDCDGKVDGVEFEALYANEVLAKCGLMSTRNGLKAMFIRRDNGAVSLEERFSEHVCISPLCRSAVTRFWVAIRGCSDAGYWGSVAMAWQNAKAECLHLQEQTDQARRWVTTMQATFGNSDTGSDAAMRRTEAAIQSSMAAGLAAGDVGIDASVAERLKVQCEATDLAPPPAPKTVAPTPAPTSKSRGHIVTTEAPPPPCPRVASSKPREDDSDVPLNLSVVRVEFDMCVAPGKDSVLELRRRAGGDPNPISLRPANLTKGKVLEFPLEGVVLGTNRDYVLSLEAGVVRSCDGELLCEDFSTTFSTVQSPPRVARTELIDDRWLRMTFDTPVALRPQSQGYRLLVLREMGGHGSDAAIKALVQDWFHLKPSDHLSWVDAASGSFVEAEVGEIAIGKNGHGMLGEQQLRCAYSKDAPGGATACHDRMTFETDLCALEGLCSAKMLRIPCGVQVKAIYPKALAIAAAGGADSLAGRGAARSRACDVGPVLEAAEWEDLEESSGKLRMLWSEPVEVAKGGASLSVCELDTPSKDCLTTVPVAGGPVETCREGPCKTWQLALAPAVQESLCGRLEIRVEAGAVRSRSSAQEGKETHAVADTFKKCPVFAPQDGCWLLWDSDYRLAEGGTESGNLLSDLESSNISYLPVDTVDKLWTKLEGGSFLPSCILLPELVKDITGQHHQAFFRYLQFGGMILSAGGLANIHFISTVTGLKLMYAARKKEQPASETDFTLIPSEDGGLPEHLPALEDMVSVSVAALNKTVQGVLVESHGLYEVSEERPRKYGALEIRVGKGSLEYLAFDWHHPASDKRRVWMQLLVALLRGRRNRGSSDRRLLQMDPAAERVLAHGVEGEASDSGAEALPQDCPPQTALPENATSGLECTIIYVCPSGLDREQRQLGMDAMPSSCNDARKALWDNVLQTSSVFQSGLRAQCVNLSLLSHSAPDVAPLDSPCPALQGMRAKVHDMNAACDFTTLKEPTRKRFRSDTSYLDARVVPARVGHGESFTADVQRRMCHRPVCRQMVEELFELVGACPTNAGFPGAVARTITALQHLAGDCVQVLEPPLSFRAHFTMQGVNTISSAEMNALRDNIHQLIADILDFTQTPQGRRRGAVALLTDFVGHAADPTGAKRYASEADLSLSVQVKPRAAEEVNSSAVGKMEGVPTSQKSMAYVPMGVIGAGCSGCTVQNLQLVTLQPAWKAQNVDPHAAIYLTFEDRIAKMDPLAKVMIYPTALRSLCEQPEHRFQFFPTETGTGEMKPTTTMPTDLSGVPMAFVCQEYEVGDDDHVRVSGQTLQIKLAHPMLRNSDYVVKLPKWMLKGHSRGHSPKAVWLGWPEDKNSSSEQEYLFSTGTPVHSEATVEMAVGCHSTEQCEERSGNLTQQMGTILRSARCFLAWYRCRGDVSSPKFCDQPPVEGCSVDSRSWQKALMGLSQPDGKSVALSEASPLVKTRAEALPGEHAVARAHLCPRWVWACAALACFLLGLAIYRAAAWVADLYQHAREYDPYVCAITRFVPLKCTLLGLVLPPLHGALAVITCVPAFQRVRAVLEEVPEAAHVQTHATEAQIQQEMTYVFIVATSCSAAMLATMTFGVVARFKERLEERGQKFALLSVVAAGTAVAGAITGWAASAEIRELPLYQDTGFQTTMLIMGCCVLVSNLLTLCAGPLLTVLLLLPGDGLGDILRYYCWFLVMQRFSWRDGEGAIGHWSRWVLHIQEARCVYGFVEALRKRNCGDGFLFLRFYSTDTPGNIVTTRSFAIRSSDTGDTQSFEGESVSLNITNPLAVLVIDVMYQAQSGAPANRIASTLWDPWNKAVLSKCFGNWPLCNPLNNRLALWNPKDLEEMPGTPKSGTYSEFRLNLAPEMGILSLQATHLGPMQQTAERANPGDPPVRVTPLGDTCVAQGNVYYRRQPSDSLEGAFLSRVRHVRTAPPQGGGGANRSFTDLMKRAKSDGGEGRPNPVKTRPATGFGPPVQGRGSALFASERAPLIGPPQGPASTQRRLFASR